MIHGTKSELTAKQPKNEVLTKYKKKIRMNHKKKELLTIRSTDDLLSKINSTIKITRNQT